LETNNCNISLEGHTGEILSLAILPDKRIVSGSEDKTLRIWNLQTGKCDMILTGHTEPVVCVFTLPDGRIVSSSEDTTLRIWS
jgi:COMPASS component SWD3